MIQSNHNSVLRYVPLSAGLLSMLFLTVYMIQRARIVQTQPANEFALAQLHLLGMAAALTAMAGLVISFPLRKRLSGSKVFVVGVVISIVSTVWGFVLSW